MYKEAATVLRNQIFRINESLVARYIFIKSINNVCTDILQCCTAFHFTTSCVRRNQGHSREKYFWQSLYRQRRLCRKWSVRQKKRGRDKRR